MKHKVTDYGVLRQCLFVDSLQVLKAGGYQNPGLDSMCQRFDSERTHHSALGDVQLLQTIFANQVIIFTHTFTDIMSYLQQKLPVAISMTGLEIVVVLKI